MALSAGAEPKFPRCPACGGWGSGLVKEHGYCDYCYRCVAMAVGLRAAGWCVLARPPVVGGGAAARAPSERAAAAVPVACARACSKMGAGTKRPRPDDGAGGAGGERGAAVSRAAERGPGGVAAARNGGGGGGSGDHDEEGGSDDDDGPLDEAAIAALLDRADAAEVSVRAFANGKRERAVVSSRRRRCRRWTRGASSPCCWRWSAGSPRTR